MRQFIINSSNVNGNLAGIRSAAAAVVAVRDDQTREMRSWKPHTMKSHTVSKLKSVQQTTLSPTLPSVVVAVPSCGRSFESSSSSCLSSSSTWRADAAAASAAPAAVWATLVIHRAVTL